MATIKYRDTHAGWLGPKRKQKKNLTDHNLVMRIEYGNSALSKEEIEQAIAAGDTFEVKAYKSDGSGKVTLFKVTGSLSSDPWGIDVGGERVAE